MFKVSSFKKKLLGLFFLTITLFSVIAVNVSKADDDKSFSFYKISSTAATYFNEALAPKGKFEGVWIEDRVKNNSGMTGAFLGFSDANRSKGITDFIMSFISKSSASVSYKALEDSASSVNILGYAYYGATLSDLGLDRVRAGGFTMGSIPRAIAGGILYVLYNLTYFLDYLFMLVGNVLQAINPFRLFIDGVNAVLPKWQSLATSETVPAPLQSLASYIKYWYVEIFNLSFAVTIPAFIVLLMVGYIFFNNSGQGKETNRLRLRSFIFRTAFLVLGVPMLGSIYSSVLNEMSNPNNYSGASAIIYENFIDFETWALKHRLLLPNSATIQWDAKNSRAGAKSISNIHVIAKSVNGMSVSWKGLTNNNINWINNHLIDIDGNSPNIDVNNGYVGQEGERKHVLSMLSRYMSSTMVYSSDFETVMKTNLRAEEAEDYFTKADEPKELKDLDPTTNPLFATNGGGLFYNSASGKITATGTQNAYNTLTQPVTLSPIAMYNYLNTNFSRTNMTIYSSEQASSGFVKEGHSSVNLIGSGLQPLFIWSGAVLQMGVLMVIGFFYSFSMLIGSLRRSIAVVTSVPFAMLGSLHAISKVIVLTIVMISEIFVSLFVYSILGELINAVPSILNGFVAQYVGTSGFAAGAMFYFTHLLTIAYYIWFLKMALKLRGDILKSFNDMSTKIIEKIILNKDPNKGGGGGNSPRPHPNGPKAAATSGAGGFAQGAGLGAMSAGANMVKGNKGTPMGEAEPESVATGKGDENIDNDNRSDDSYNNNSGTPVVDSTDKNDDYNDKKFGEKVMALQTLSSPLALPTPKDDDKNEDVKSNNNVDINKDDKDSVNNNVSSIEIDKPDSLSDDVDDLSSAGIIQTEKDAKAVQKELRKEGTKETLSGVKDTGKAGVSAVKSATGLAASVDTGNVSGVVSNGKDLVNDGKQIKGGVKKTVGGVNKLSTSKDDARKIVKSNKRKDKSNTSGLDVSQNNVKSSKVGGVAINNDSSKSSKSISTSGGSVVNGQNNNKSTNLSSNISQNNVKSSKVGGVVVNNNSSKNNKSALTSDGTVINRRNNKEPSKVGGVATNSGLVRNGKSIETSGRNNNRSNNLGVNRSNKGNNGSKISVNNRGGNQSSNINVNNNSGGSNAKFSNNFVDSNINKSFGGNVFSESKDKIDIHKTSKDFKPSLKGDFTKKSKDNFVNNYKEHKGKANMMNNYFKDKQRVNNRKVKEETIIKQEKIVREKNSKSISKPKKEQNVIVKDVVKTIKEVKHNKKKNNKKSKTKLLDLD